MAEAYRGFAQVYDLFMGDIPYQAWSDYIACLLREYGVEDGLVLDLGCGTGTLTRLLAGHGYDMIGLDVSAEMLQVAMEKQEMGRQGAEPQQDGRPESRLACTLPDILYLQQDMREFELYGTVRAVVCVCDSINYILEEEELATVCSLVNNYLDPGGIFIFDLNTIFKYETVLGDAVIAENREEGSFIWENDYDPESGINEYGLTLFVRDEDGRFSKYEENHYQRAYSQEQIELALAAGGLAFVAAYDAFTYEPIHEKSERIYVVAREQGKGQRAEQNRAEQGRAEQGRAESGKGQNRAESRTKKRINLV